MVAENNNFCKGVEFRDRGGLEVTKEWSGFTDCESFEEAT